MRKITKILLLCLIAFVYYHSCVSYFWHKECMQHDIEKLHNYNHMPEQVRVIYNVCKHSKLENQAEELGKDYWKAPYETERDGGGDCEDLSIWLLDKLWKMGYDAWLVVGRNDYQCHVWTRVRISDGRFSTYYDVDMTKRFVRVGLEEVKFSGGFEDKFEEVMKRQRKYEEGEK